MTDSQRYLVIGLPTLAVVLGMITNGFLFNALSARMSSLEARMLALQNRIEARLLAFETSVNQRIDILTGKISDLDTRLSIMEDRWKRS
ncbi:MAG TPA: hypothetical protein VNY05_08635 [Candidatus Acidoferrales bacterium]|jgi:hypothetical protein|nr:hypothetical protein [Candidatus Acidoferrales bacterium]